MLLGYTHVWIGLTDVVDEVIIYVYPSNGLRPRYSNWQKTEPGGSRGENCACLRTEQRLWNDYPCSSRMSYVCKKTCKTFCVRQGTFLRTCCDKISVIFNSFKIYDKLFPTIYISNQVLKMIPNIVRLFFINYLN